MVAEEGEAGPPRFLVGIELDTVYVSLLRQPVEGVVCLLERQVRRGSDFPVVLKKLTTYALETTARTLRSMGS